MTESVFMPLFLEETERNDGGNFYTPLNGMVKCPSRGEIMDIIFKVFHYLFVFGCGAIGAYVAFVALSVVLGVVGAMLGSGIGTVILIAVFWAAYKKWKENHPNDVLL